MKKSYAVATIQGRVASKPERGDWNGKPFADLEIAVVRKTYDGGEEEMIVEVRTWNEKLFPVIDALEVNQGVQVVADVDSKEQTTNGGAKYYKVSLRPQAVVPGLAPASAGGSGVASAQRQQDAHPSTPQGGNYGNYTPPANGREAAQLPHEDEEDLPF